MISTTTSPTTTIGTPSNSIVPSFFISVAQAIRNLAQPSRLAKSYSFVEDLANTRDNISFL